VNGEIGGQMDSMLLPFLSTSDELEAEILLADLISGYTVPVVKGIVRSMFGENAAREIYYRAKLTQDLEDIVADVNVKILDRLRRLKRSPEEDAIHDYRSYVAVTTYNVCNAYVRLKYPNWYRLKAKLSYTLKHHPEFALWDRTDGKSVCGLSEWRGQERTASCGWISDARMDVDWYVKQGSPDEFIELLRAAFTTARAPIRIEDLVSLVGEILRIADHPDGNEVQLEYLKPSDLPGYYIDPVQEQGQRQYLRRLWNEIVQLPLPQRLTLLLAVRDDGHSSVTLIFSEICIASFREIAQAAGMSASEFTQILGNMPLDDNAISKRLGVTRQQVISYRFSARRRMARRMKFVRKRKTRR